MLKRCCSAMPARLIHLSARFFLLGFLAYQKECIDKAKNCLAVVVEFLRKILDTFSVFVYLKMCSSVKCFNVKRVIEPMQSALSEGQFVTSEAHLSIQAHKPRNKDIL